MPAMLLTRPTWADFIAWVQGLDPGFSAETVALSPAHVTVAVTQPNGSRVTVRQNQTLDAEQDPVTLTWTVTVT